MSISGSVNERAYWRAMTDRKMIAMLLLIGLEPSNARDLLKRTRDLRRKENEVVISAKKIDRRFMIQYIPECEGWNLIQLEN